jgi:hypothetical protein
MRTTLIALSVSIAMLGGTGLVQAETQADTVAPTKVQQTTDQSKLAIAGQVRATGPVVLTDSQMEKATAGHNRWYPHYGYYWRRSGSYCYQTRGWHTGGTGC